MNTLVSFLASLQLHKLVDAWALAIKFKALAEFFASLGFICGIGLILLMSGKIFLANFPNRSRSL